MAHNKLYGICESKCKVEVMSKDEMIRRAVLIATGKEPLTDCTSMYLGKDTIKTIDYIETHFVTKMQGMFSECSKLASIPVLDTSNVTGMGGMFYGCTALTSIPDLDTSNVTSMTSAFKNCTSLTTFTDNRYAPEGSRWQIKENFDVSSCPLDRESILKVFNGAQTVEEKTISISSTTNSYLSAEDKAIITAKGWTITVV